MFKKFQRAPTWAGPAGLLMNVTAISKKESGRTRQRGKIAEYERQNNMNNLDTDILEKQKTNFEGLSESQNISRNPQITIVATVQFHKKSISGYCQKLNKNKLIKSRLHKKADLTVSVTKLSNAPRHSLNPSSCC